MSSRFFKSRPVFLELIVITSEVDLQMPMTSKIILHIIKFNTIVLLNCKYELTKQSSNFNVCDLVNPNKIILRLWNTLDIIVALFNDGLVREGHLKIVFDGRKLFVGNFQCGLGNVIDFIHLKFEMNT